MSANPSGQLRTISLEGFNPDNAFFRNVGSNDRSCLTCHQPADAWSIRPESVQARFAASRGTDPIFRNNDGSNCEGAAPRTLGAKRAAYSLLLTRGLIRVGLNIPSGAEFIVDRVDDPYDCSFATNDVSVYRRPLPSANLRFVSAVMWDGRESSAGTTIAADLAQQANDATRGHAAAGRDLTPREVREIVSFELGLFTAQARDDRVGNLAVAGASGGPRALVGEPFFIGINDPTGLNPDGTAFSPNVFSLFGDWRLAQSHDAVDRARRAIARGEEIFNTRTFTISGVAGLNGATFPSGVTVPASFSGTCTVCHDTPNAGNHSVKAPLNLGLTDPAIARYLPVYTLRNITTGATVATTDPGRALITGKWDDVGKFKGPVLRGLAARAPYFHNGAAATLDEAVDFYDRRFTIGLSARDKADLAAFLGAL